MHRASILPIALMAFAIVAFLFVVTYAVTPGLKYPWSTNTATTNTTANVNSEINTNTVSNTNSAADTNTAGQIPSNVFSYVTVKAGDRIGGMTVVSARPFKVETPLVQPNAVIQFTGQVTVSGTVTSRFSDFAGSNYTCVGRLDAASLKLIPKAVEDTRSINICFSNTDLALQTFPLGTEKVATVTLDHYTINDFPTEVLNMAVFIPDTSATANWKTYTNTTGGYSFKFPADDTVESFNGSYSTVIKDNKGTIISEIRYRLDSADGSLSTWFDTAPTDDIRLGNKTGKKFIYRYCDGPSCGPDTVAYVVQYRDKLLGLEFPGDKVMDFSETQILNSFSFIPPIADWKTYTNTTEHYAIQYPSNWTPKEVADLNEVQFTETGSTNIIQPSIRVRAGVSLDDIKKELTDNLSTIGNSLTRNIGGITASGFSYTGAIGADYDLYMISRNSKSFVFFSAKDDSDWQRALGTLTLITDTDVDG